MFIGSKVLVEVSTDNALFKPNKAIMNATQYRLEQNLRKNDYFDAVVQQISKNRLMVFIPNEFDIKEIEKVVTPPQTIQFKKLVSGETYRYPKYENSDLTVSDFKNVRYKKFDNNSYVVSIEFNKIGTEKFAKLTKELINKQLAIFINGELMSAPVVREAITDGKVQISGGEYGFSYNEAKEMADMLNASIIPATIKIIEVK